MRLLFILVGFITLTLINFKSYAQARNYLTVTPASGVRAYSTGLGGGQVNETPGAGAGSVTNVANAASANSNFATLSSGYFNILVAGYEGESRIQLKSPSIITGGQTTYIRFDVPTTTGLSLDLLNLVGSLTGLLDQNFIQLDAYSGATAAAEGTIVPAAQVSSRIVRDAAGLTYLAVTSNQDYNSVMVRLRYRGNLLGLALGAAINMNVYHAFTVDGENCAPSIFASNGESTGINVTLTELVRNPQQAVDQNMNTFSQLQAGVVGVGSTVSQTIYLNGVSSATDYAKVVISVPPSILTLGLFNNITFQAFNGNTAIGTPVSVNTLLNLDLLTLFANTRAVPVFFNPGAPFDRVRITMGQVVAAGGNILSGGLNIHEVQRTVAKPTFAGVTNGAASVCGTTVSLSVSNPTSGVTYNYFRAGAGTRISLASASGSTFSETGIGPGTYTYYVSAQKAGCTAESDIDSVAVTVTAIPDVPAATAAAICAGSPGVFTVTTPATGITYNWYAAAAGGTPVATGTSFTTSTPLIANTTYYLEAVNGTCISPSRTAVEVTVNPLPDDAIVSSNSVTISSGQTAVLTASAPTAGSTVNWYTSAAGGLPVGTGTTFTTPELTTNTTYYTGTLSASGCPSVNRIAVTVNVTNVTPGITCNAANAQQSGVNSLVCLNCQVIGATNSIDNDPDNFSRISLVAGVAATGFQRLIFPAAGLATDSIRLSLGLPSGVADVNVLGAITVNVMSGSTVVRTYQLNSSLLNISLLGGSRFNATVAAGAVYDRVEVRFGGLASVLSALDVYGAQVIYPNPTVATTGLDICPGNATTLSATPNGGTTLAWFSAATGGTAIQSGNTLTTDILNGSTTYYIEVSRGGCPNPVRLPVSVNVNPAIGFTAASLTNATVGAAYSQQLAAATGGTPAFTYTLAPGTTLPAGLVLSSTGLISGTPTAIAAAAGYSIVATDSKGCTATASFNLTVTPALQLPPATLPNGIVGTAYPTQTLPAATGGTGPYTYAATNLPPGLSFDNNTRSISGTPTQAGTYTVTVTVTDANNNTAIGNYTIIVRDPLVLPGGALANGTVGQPYPTQTIPAATGGSGTYTYTAGTLPAGLSFNPATREIAGTPTVAGNYTVPITVTDTEGNTITSNYTVAIRNPLVLPPATLADGNVGVPYTSQPLPAATGGTPNYTYLESSLPPGLTFNRTTRVISGTPTQSGLYSIPVTVTDANGTTASATYSVRVIGALSLPSMTLADGTVGSPYTAQTLPAVTGGTGPYTYLESNLPPGMTFNRTTRQFAGTPTLGGSFTFTITASDASGNTTNTNYTLAVRVPAPAAAAANVCAGTPATLTVSNPVAGVTYNWYPATGNTAVATGTSFTTDPVSANTTFFVEGVSGTAVSTRTAVSVTVRPAPALAMINGSTTISTGQTATLNAAAEAGNTISWYATPTGGTALATGPTYTTPALNATTTYYVETQNASGCVSPTRVPVVVNVIAGPVNPACNAAVSQQSGVNALLCVLCGVTDPGNSVDTDPNNFTRISLSVGVGATGFQRLIFANAGTGTDSIRLDLATPVGLADVAVLGGVTVRVMNGTSVVTTYNLSSSLLNLQLLSGNRFAATLLAGGAYDRVEVSFAATVAALSSLDIYGATVIYPNPTVAATGQTICAGNATTLSATANGGTTLRWYDVPTGGNALPGGATFTTPVLNATTTYYIEVVKNNCANAQRIPVTVTVTPAPTAPVLATVLPVCYGATATLAVNNPVAGITYNWYNAATGGTVLFSGDTYTTPALMTNATFYVEALSPGCGASARTAVPVTVNPMVALPQLQASATTVNAGQAVILNATSTDADVTFNWYTSATSTTPVYTGPTYVTPPLTATTTYFVTSTSTLTGCTSVGRVQVTITVNTGGSPNPVPCEAATVQTGGVRGVALLAGVFNPELAIDNDTQTGSSLVMPVGALGASVFQRLTFASGASTPGDTLKVLVSTPGRLLSLGVLSGTSLVTYNGGVSNNDGVTNSGLINLQLLSNDSQALLTFVPTATFDAVELVLNAGVAGVLNSIDFNYAQRILVAPTANTAGTTACATQTTTLTVNNPNPALTYRWYNATGTTLLATGTSYTTDPLTANIRFLLESSNANGCTSYRTPVEVTVTPAPAAPVLVSDDVRTCAGSNVTLAVKDPIVGVTYKWYDGANVYQANQDGPTFTVSNVTTTANYSVRAENSCGVPSAATSATIDVGALDPAVVTPTSVTILSGTPAVLTASSSTSGAMFRWYDSAAGTTVLSNDARYVTPVLTNPGATPIVVTYYVEAYVPGGCIAATRTAAQVTVLPVGTPTDVPCEPATIAIRDGVDGVALLSAVFNPGQAADNNAASASSFVMPVGALGASIYQHVGFTGLSTVGDTVRISVTSPGKLLSLAVLPSIEFTTFKGLVSNNDTQVASNPAIQLNLLSDNSAAIFSFVPTAQFDGVELRLRSGLASVLNSLDFNYAQRVLVAPVVQSANASACVGTAATLRVSNPVAGITYNWYIGTATSPAGTGDTFPTSATLTAGTYDYYVTANRNNCESAKTKVTLTVLAAPTAPVALGQNPPSTCPNTAVALGVVPVTGVSFNWYDAAVNGNLLAANTDTYTTPATLVPGTYTYYVAAVNGNACVSTAARTAITLIVNPFATQQDITVTGADLPLCAGTVANLLASAPDVTSPVFTWYSDAALTNVVSNVALYTPTVSQTTTFYVTVTGSNRCPASPQNAKAVVVTVKPTATQDDITIAGADASVCAGAQVTLTASTATVTNPVFAWFADAALTQNVSNLPTYSPTLTQTTTFYVVVSGDNKCANLPGAAKEVTVTVNPKATAANITVTGAGAFCAGSTATLTATAVNVINPQFFWYSDAQLGTTPVSTSATFSPVVTADVNYYVIVRGDNFCPNDPADARVVSLTLNPTSIAADIDVSGDNVRLCAGGRATLTASSTTITGPVFIWYNDAQLTDIAFMGTTFVTPVLNATTTYYVTVSGANKCDNLPGAARAVTVTVSPYALPADIDVAGNDAPFCAGTEAILTASSTLSGAIFNWYNDATLTDLEFSGPVFRPTLTQTTTFYVTVSAADRCENRVGDAKVLTLVVNPPATAADLIVSGAALPFCAGTEVTLNATSTTVTSPVFTWYSDAALSDPLFTGADFTRTLNVTTTFYVTVKGANKCENLPGTARAITVTVNPAPDAPVVANGGANICAGDRATLSIQNPQAGITYQWYDAAVGGSLLAEGTSYLTDMLSATREYFVQARSASGCTNATGRVKATVTVAARPSTPAVTTATLSTCSGNVVMLSVANPVSGVTYNWYDAAAGGTVLGQGSNFTTPVITANRSFYVEAVSTTCTSAARASVLVTVNPPALASDIVVSGADVPFCAGAEVTLNASSTTVTNPVFTWYSDAALTDAILTGPQLVRTLTVTTTFYVTVKGDNKCENSAATARAVTITVNPLPDVPIVTNGGAAICSGERTTLTIQNAQAGITYQWYDAAAGGTMLAEGASYTTDILNATKDYYVLALSASGCGSNTGRVKVTVTVSPKPLTPTVTSAAVNTCAGSTAVLGVSNPQQNVTYNWYSQPTGGTSLGSGADFTTAPISAVTVFYVEASTATCTSTGRTAVTVTPLALPVAPTAVNGATNPICESTAAVLSVNGPNAAFTYQWFSVQVGGTPLAEGDTFTIPSINATTTYYVGSINTATGCISATRTPVVVTILPKLDAPVVTAQPTATSINFVWPAVTGATAYEVSLDNGVTWFSPSSGTAGTSHLVTGLKPDQAVTIRVRALGQLDCQTSDATTLTARASNPQGNEVFIPNTFTPNNDGQNDIFYVYGNTIAKMTLRVYNQWGQFLFQSLATQSGWDGTYKGELQPNGVYVYMLEAEFNDGTKTTKKGTITLLR